MTAWDHVVKLWPFWSLLVLALSSRYWRPGRTISRVLRRG